MVITLLVRYEREMGDLREFYDPDTVDLMQWLQQHTPPTAVISGSMQLMAGVLLCTGRTLTNHPHFEDQVILPSDWSTLLILSSDWSRR